MRQKSAGIFFLFLSLALASSDPQTEADFFSAVHKHPHLFTIVLDSNECPQCFAESHQIISKLRAAHVSKSHRIEYMTTDLHKIPSIRQHFKLKRKYTVYLFVRNHVLRFKKLKLSWKASIDSENLADAIHRKMKRINRKVRSMSRLNLAVEKHKSIFLLIDRSGKKRRLFQQVAESNVKERLFHFASAGVQEEFFGLHPSAFADLRDDQICVFRHPSRVSELDPQIECHRLEDLKGAQLFVDFYKHPKLREKSRNSDILKDMYWKQQTALFLVVGQNPQFKEVFVEALKQLPRRMIYAVTLIEEAEPTFLQIFMMAKTVHIPDSVYAAFAVPGGELRLQRMEAKLTRENIVEFAYEFMLSNKWLFEYDFDKLKQEKGGAEEVREGEL